MIRYIDAHRERFGVESICRALRFAPSTYWSAKRRPPSVRSMRNEELEVEIPRVFEENIRVYGAPKIWAQLNREVDWFNHRRLFHELGRNPTRRIQENHYKQKESDQTVETHTIETA